MPLTVLLGVFYFVGFCSTQLLMASQSDPARIWYQSFVDPHEQRPYFLRLEEQLQSYAAPHVHFDVHGVSPPDRYLSALTEMRCAAQAVRGAIQAQRDGYDAVVIGHFQEPGLIECRCALDIPVIGLGEATMLTACSLGRTFGWSPSIRFSSPGIAIRSGA